MAWQSKLQGSVAMSTTEAEYIALSAAALEAVFLRGLLHDLDCNQEEPTIIREDNFGCVQLTKNEVLHSRTKHIDIRHHKLRELVADKTIAVHQCPTELFFFFFNDRVYSSYYICVIHNSPTCSAEERQKISPMPNKAKVHNEPRVRV